MELDPKLAKELVSNFKAITNHEINLFNAQGIIVASTDSSRIGTTHAGALQAINTMKNVSILYDGQFEGARKGINIPVVFNHAAVAVVGITGDPQEVEPFGNTIKKMAEILLKESSTAIGNFNRRINMTNLVNLFMYRGHDDDYARYLASLLEIDLSVPRIAIMGKALTPEESFFDFDETFFSLNAAFKLAPDSPFTISGHELHAFVTENSLQSIERALLNIKQEAESRHPGLRICFGLGEVQASSVDYWKSARQARQAVQFLLLSPDKAILEYQSLDSGILLANIPQEAAEHFVQKVFAELSDNEIAYYQHIFDSYTVHNGSISACADELALHKNTLQNKLNRLGKLTGYNPRRLQDFPILWLAFMLRTYQLLPR